LFLTVSTICIRAIAIGTNVNAIGLCVINLSRLGYMAFHGAKFFPGLKIFISVCVTVTADFVLELSETQLL